MKIKLLPVLATIAAMSAIATPMIIHAQPPLQLAQEMGPPGPPPLENLNLSAEQKSQLDQIRANTDSQIEGILSADQKQQFQRIQQLRQQLQAAMRELNLSQQQREQMRSIHQSALDTPQR